MQLKQSHSWQAAAGSQAWLMFKIRNLQCAAARCLTWLQSPCLCLFFCLSGVQEKEAGCEVLCPCNRNGEAAGHGGNNQDTMKHYELPLFYSPFR